MTRPAASVTGVVARAAPRRGATKLCVLLAAALLGGVAGCAAEQAPALSADNLLIASLGDARTGEMFVISDYMNPPAATYGRQVWGVDDGRAIRLLQREPRTSMSEVHEIAVSEDGAYLAVIAIGEGHPIVEIFDLGAILKTEEGGEGRQVEALGYVDPYPGRVSHIRWDEDSLLMESDMPLDRLDPESRRVDYLRDPALPRDVDRTYRWNVSRDAITAEKTPIEPVTDGRTK